MTNTTHTTDTTETTDVQGVIDGCFACWNATDPDTRVEAIGRTWAVDAHHDLVRWGWEMIGPGLPTTA